MSARVARLGGVHAPLEAQRAGDRRYHRFVAVLADAYFDLAREVDAVDEFQEPMHEMLARLFAVGDDIDAGVLLAFDRKQGRVELALGKLRPGKLPRRP
jgi:hypothetical protein